MNYDARLYRCAKCRQFKDRKEFDSNKSGRRKENCSECLLDVVRGTPTQMRESQRQKLQRDNSAYLQHVINGWARSKANL